MLPERIVVRIEEEVHSIERDLSRHINNIFCIKWNRVYSSVID